MMGYQLRWGKYKGYDIKDVPKTYLLWLYRNNLEVTEAIEKCLGTIDLENQVKSNYPNNLSDSISSLRRRLAKRYHPDSGGSNESMAAVNATIDEVLYLLKD